MGNSQEVIDFDQSMLEQCEALIGYKFSDISLLKQALTHASLRDKNGVCNERLEFLGDAVLGMVISEFLYRTFHDFDEGDLSLIKSEVVSRDTLAHLAEKLELHSCFACSRGVQNNKKGIPTSMLANVMEAVIGAIYLDSSLKTVNAFIVDNLRDEVEKVIRNPYQKNYKSLLQFLAQKYLGNTPLYKILRIEGPNHTRIFTACAMVGKRKFIAGKGNNKKEAEQSAAYAAIQILALENPEIGEFIQNFMDNEKKNDPLSSPTLFHNSKSLLQYVAEKFSLPPPEYAKTHSVQNNKKYWFVSVSLGGRNFPKFISDDRREAERMAAREALQILAQEYAAKSTALWPPGKISLSPIPLWRRLQWLGQD